MNSPNTNTEQITTDKEVFIKRIEEMILAKEINMEIFNQDELIKEIKAWLGNEISEVDIKKILSCNYIGPSDPDKLFEYLRDEYYSLDNNFQTLEKYALHLIQLAYFGGCIDLPNGMPT